MPLSCFCRFQTSHIVVSLVFILQQARKFIPEVDLTGIEKKILLVEILSCRELVAADKNGLSDPYVLARLGFKDLHKTKHIKRSLNPIYSKEHKNSFIIDCSVSELFGANGVLFKVIDYDGGIISGDDELGSVQIPATTMYECQQEEYHLDPPVGRNEDPGYVTIRITEISKEERDLHKRGKLSAPLQRSMPAGLNTSESRVSSSTNPSVSRCAFCWAYPFHTTSPFFSSAALNSYICKSPALISNCPIYMTTRDSHISYFFALPNSCP